MIAFNDLGFCGRLVLEVELLYHYLINTGCEFEPHACQVRFTLIFELARIFSHSVFLPNKS